jgi:hypothetical protein
MIYPRNVTDLEIVGVHEVNNTLHTNMHIVTSAIETIQLELGCHIFKRWSVAIVIER